MELKFESVPRYTFFDKKVVFSMHTYLVTCKSTMFIVIESEIELRLIKTILKDNIIQKIFPKNNWKEFKLFLTKECCDLAAD